MTPKEITGLTKEQIDTAMVDILIKYGPDGHCDGHDTITDFVLALLQHKGIEWCESMEIEYTYE